MLAYLSSALNIKSALEFIKSSIIFCGTFLFAETLTVPSDFILRLIFLTFLYCRLYLIVLSFRLISFIIFLIISVLW